MKRDVLALHVDDQHDVPRRDPALDEQASKVRLARAGLAAEQHVGLSARDGGGRPVGEAPDRHAPPRRAHWPLAGPDRPRQQRGDAGAVGPLEHEVGVRPQRGHGVGHRHSNLRGLQQRQVVLGIANRKRVMRRDAQLDQRREQPGAL